MSIQWDSLAALGDEAGTLVASHFATAFRTFVKHPSLASGPGYLRYITGEMHPLGNCVVLDGEVPATTIAEVVKPLSEAPLPTAVVSTRPLGPDGEATLAQAGFSFAGDMPAMAVDIAALAASPLPEGYTLKTYGAERSEEYVDAFAEGYGLPRALAAMFSPAEADNHDHVVAYGVEKDGQIVATSILILADGVAGVYCVSTVPEERKKGLGAHVTAEPLRQMQVRGYKVGVLQSSESGYPVYKKLGFQDVGGVPLYVRMPG